MTVVVEDLSEHGANRVTVDRAMRWLEAGDDLTLLTVVHEDPTRALTLPEGLRVVRATTPEQRFRTVLPVALAQLMRAARQSDVLVSGTETGLGVLLGAVAARVTRTPFAVTVQSDLVPAVESYVSPKLRPLNRRAVLRSDLAVCVSPALAGNLHGLGMPAERVAVALNGVPAEQIRAAARASCDLLPDDLAPDDRAPDGGAPGVRTLVAMGRLEPQKGFDLLLRAHRLALDAGAPPHRVVVFGEGPQREPLQALARELGITDSVHLAGFSSSPFPALARSAAFVLPSRWEGLPLCLAEALACSVPCVAFDCPTGPADVLDGGRYGRLVPAGDVAALATALREHLLDEAPLRARALEASQSSLEIFDPALAAGRHRDALQSLVARRGSRRRSVRRGGGPAGSGSRPG